MGIYTHTRFTTLEHENPKEPQDLQLNTSIPISPSCLLPFLPVLRNFSWMFQSESIAQTENTGLFSELRLGCSRRVAYCLIRN